MDRKDQQKLTFDAMDSNVETNNSPLGGKRSRGRHSPKYLVTLETPLPLAARVKMPKNALDRTVLI